MSCRGQKTSLVDVSQKCSVRLVDRRSPDLTEYCHPLELLAAVVEEHTKPSRVKRNNRALPGKHAECCDTGEPCQPLVSSALQADCKSVRYATPSTLEVHHATKRRKHNGVPRSAAFSSTAQGLSGEVKRHVTRLAVPSTKAVSDSPVVKAEHFVKNEVAAQGPLCIEGYANSVPTCEAGSPSADTTSMVQDDKEVGHGPSDPYEAASDTSAKSSPVVRPGGAPAGRSRSQQLVQVSHVVMHPMAAAAAAAAATAAGPHNTQVPPAFAFPPMIPPPPMPFMPPWAFPAAMMPMMMNAMGIPMGAASAFMRSATGMPVPTSSASAPSMGADVATGFAFPHPMSSSSPGQSAGSPTVLPFETSESKKRENDGTHHHEALRRVLESLDLAKIKHWVVDNFSEEVYLMLLDAWRLESPKVHDAVWAYQTHIERSDVPDYRAFLVTIFGLERLLEASGSKFMKITRDQ